MGYDKDCEILAEGFYGVHYGLFGFVVEGAGGFVEDDDVGLFVEGSGYADALALASGETDASFAYVGFVFFWPGFDDVGYLCLLGGMFDSLAVDFVYGDSKGYVFFDGAVCKEDGLGNVGYMGLPRAIIARGDWLTIDIKRTFGWGEQTHNDIEQSAFATAGDAHKAESRAFRNGKCKVFEYKGGFWCVTKGEIFNRDAVLEWNWPGWWLIDIIGQWLVEQLEGVPQGSLSTLDR